MRPGTTMTFLGVAPANVAITLSSASVAASTVATSAPVATSTRPRTLPLIWIGYVDGLVDQQRRVGRRELGVRHRVSWPSRRHSSSATCGASGASMSTSGSATSRGFRQPGHPVVQLDQLGDRGVEPDRLHVAADHVDHAVQQLAGLVVGRASTTRSRAGLLVDKVAPQTLKEPVYAGDIRVRHTGLVQRSQIHLVEPHRVAPVLLADFVGRYGIFKALAHLAEFWRTSSPFRRNLPPFRSSTSSAAT